MTRQSSGSRTRSSSSTQGSSNVKKAASLGNAARRNRRTTYKYCADCSRMISYSNFSRHTREKHGVVQVEEAPNVGDLGYIHIDRVVPGPARYDCPASTCPKSYTRRCSLRRHQERSNHYEPSPSSTEDAQEVPIDAGSPSDSDTYVGSQSPKAPDDYTFPQYEEIPNMMVNSPYIVGLDLMEPGLAQQSQGAQEVVDLQSNTYTDHQGVFWPQGDLHAQYFVVPIHAHSTLFYTHNAPFTSNVAISPRLSYTKQHISSGLSPKLEDAYTEANLEFSQYMPYHRDSSASSSHRDSSALSSHPGTWPVAPSPDYSITSYSRSSSWS